MSKVFTLSLGMAPFSIVFAAAYTDPLARAMIVIQFGQSQAKKIPFAAGGAYPLPFGVHARV